ncbi:MAG: biopolymer transporter ExbD [Planctomycetota bacterium]|jgi:biopolymer transport protein ExbD
MSRRKKGVTWAMPLVDLLFVLLFALLALSDSRRSNAAEPVRIELPDVEPGAGVDMTSLPTIVIELDSESKVRLPDRADPIEGPAELDTLLDERIGAGSPKDFEIEIHGDARARHGVGVALLQHLRNRGFAGVTLLALGNDDAGWTGAK